VKGLVVPLPATSVGVVNAEFVAYLKPVAVTALPPSVKVAFSVAAVAVSEFAAWVSTVGDDAGGASCKQRTEKPFRVRWLNRPTFEKPEYRMRDHAFVPLGEEDHQYPLVP
jgi:hypothetical protein